jgi:ribA/ribD-fused uncharacterized protein
MEIYKKEDVCFFNKVREQWGGLSNMTNEYAVNVNGTLIKNTEALYQAARFPDYPEIQMEIIRGHSGMSSKMTSKKYRKTHTRADWDEVAVDIMMYCLQLKLYQNYMPIRNILIETGNKDIVEKSHKDQMWGAVEKDGLLIGNNILGKLWMNIRPEMDKYYTKPHHDIPNFVFLGKFV